MSLDIHLSKNEKDAELVEPEMFFPENLHDAIFIHKKGFKKEFKQFNRMHDYYADIFYIGDQILELKLELLEIERSTDYSPLKEFSKELIGLCEKAISNRKNIYCFCD